MFVHANLYFLVFNLSAETTIAVQKLQKFLRVYGTLKTCNVSTTSRVIEIGIGERCSFKWTLKV